MLAFLHQEVKKYEEFMFSACLTGGEIQCYRYSQYSVGI